MNWRKLTKLVILLVVAGAIVYDLIAWQAGTVDATISRVTLAWAHRWPVVPFSVGVLCGHLFWSQPQLPK